MGLLMRFINFWLAVAISAATVLNHFEPDKYNLWYGFIETEVERLAVPVAIAIIALNLYAILSAMKRRFTKRRDIEIASSDGQIIISVSAVEKRLLDLATKFSDVRQARVALKFTKKDAVLRCALNFGLARDNDISGRVEEIKRCLRDAFLRLLPGAPGLEITAKINELRAEDPKTPANNSGDFYGPVYPSTPETTSGEEQ